MSLTRVFNFTWHLASSPHLHCPLKGLWLVRTRRGRTSRLRSGGRAPRTVSRQGAEKTLQAVGMQADPHPLHFHHLSSGSETEWLHKPENGTAIHSYVAAVF